MGATQKIVMGAILFLLGAILIGIVASEQYKQTSLANVNNELVDIAFAKSVANRVNGTFTLANVYTGADGWKTEYSDCNFDVDRYGNASTAFTVTTDYTFTSAGVMTILNTTATLGSTTNSTYVNYNYCPDDYMAQGWGRSVLSMLGGLLALMLLGSAVGIFYEVYKEAVE